MAEAHDWKLGEQYIRAVLITYSTSHILRCLDLTSSHLTTIILSYLFADSCRKVLLSTASRALASFLVLYIEIRVALFPEVFPTLCQSCQYQLLRLAP